METSEYIEDDLDALLAEDEVIEDHGDEAAEDEDSERNDNELLLAHHTFLIYFVSLYIF